MQNYLKGDIVLVRYPFSDLSGTKVRPAVVVSSPHTSQDVFIVPLTSKTVSLLSGEFVLKDWRKEGLNEETAVSGHIYRATAPAHSNRWRTVRWRPSRNRDVIAHLVRLIKNNLSSDLGICKYLHQTEK